MSMTLMAQAMSIKVGNPIRKLVLIKLADNANDKGECWPSYQHIADQCEIGRSTVKSHIKALEDMGLVRREYRKNGAQNQSNLFHLNFNKSFTDASKAKTLRNKAAEMVGLKPGKGVGQDLTGVGHELTGGGQEMTQVRSAHAPGGGSGAAPITSHSLEPVIEPINKTPAARATCQGEWLLSRYAFEGKVVKLNHADFASWQKLYAHLDLVYELQKLDIEFSYQKPRHWFITASQKLSYQNKQAALRGQIAPAGTGTPHWNDRSEWENNFL